MNKSFKTLPILHIAMLSGQAMFIAVVYFVASPQMDITLETPYAAALGLITGGGIMLSMLMWRKRISAPPLLGTTQEKLQHYTTSCLLRWAVLEAPALLAIVLMLVTHSLFPIFAALGCMALFLVAKPDKEFFQRVYEVSEVE